MAFRHKQPSAAFRNKQPCAISHHEWHVNGWDENAMIKMTRIVLMEMNWVMGGEKHQKGKDCTAMCGMNAEGLHLQSGTVGENATDPCRTCPESHFGDWMVRVT
jgi:hypothetical protein